MDDSNSTSVAQEILSKLNHVESLLIDGVGKKDYLTDEDLNKNYNISRNVRQRLVVEGKLTKFKVSGDKGPSLYLRSEVEELISNSKFQPKVKSED